MWDLEANRGQTLPIRKVVIAGQTLRGLDRCGKGLFWGGAGTDVLGTLFASFNFPWQIQSWEVCQS